MLATIRATIAAVTIATALVIAQAPALAVPEASAQALCSAAPTNYDMIGRYSSPTELLSIEIYACGGLYLEWYRDGIWHPTSYRTVNHLSGGGIATVGMAADPYTGAWLGGTDRLVIKPAEPGYIQAAPWDPQWGPIKVYRLLKIT